MYNSREIGELRADVAVNCRTLIERAAARGLPVLVVPVRYFVAIC